MENRKYSSKINYDRFEELYTPSSSSNVSRAVSEAGSPGGMLMGPSTSSTRPRSTKIASSRSTKIAGDDGREGRGEQQNALEIDEQQKELESIAGELESIAGEVDEEIEIEETEDEEDDGDDGDPYAGMGYDSD